MKVLHISNHFYPCIGGVETFVKDLCLALKQNGVVCEVLCLDRCPNNQKKLPHSDEFNGMAISRVPAVNLKYYKPAFFDLAFIKNFDCIHVHSLGFFSDFLLATRAIHKKPVIVSTHGGIWHTKKISFLKKIYFNLLQSILLKNADLIIADSQNDFDLFSKKAKKLCLIENGVDLSKFSGIEKNDFSDTIIFLGRISKNKNLQALIESFSIVAKKMPSAKLFIVGKNFDENLEQLKNIILVNKLLKNVFFLGEVNEKVLFDLVGQSSFCVYASSFEGFGISVLELMSAGIIPILNDIPTFNRFVKNGKNGYIADFDDPQNAAQTILSALMASQTVKKRISASARASAVEFSWPNKIQEYILAYQKVIGQKKEANN